jgi:hypothetical protein
MTDISKRTIPVTSDLSVTLYEHVDPREGSYISIKHNTAKRNMEGEVLIGPSDVPAMIKALTEAALELSSSSYWYTGYDNGFRAAIRK